MAPRPARTARRPLVVLYLAAVVGPTLAVLTLGVIAARRQVMALDALKLTTDRLQESSVAVDIERSLTSRATTVLADPTFNELASAASRDDTRLLDQSQQRVLALPTRYPFVRFVFVVVDGEIRYPRILPPWPSASASPVGEDARRGAALAAQATLLERAGNRVASSAAYRRLYDELGDTYSPGGRPYALVAALELVRLGATGDSRVQEARQRLRVGRWSLTAEQARYFLERFPHAAEQEPSTPFLDAATEAGRLAATPALRPDRAPGRISFAAIGEGADFLQLAYRADTSNRIVGFAFSFPWIRDRLVPEIVGGVVSDRRADLLPLAAGHPGFRTVLPGWSIRLLPSGPDPPGWLRTDVLAFAAIAVVVLGVLVLGVVMLMRDVQRETKLNQLRADLVSGVSHELKTPLSVIRVYAETIDDVGEVADADRRRFAAAIVQETERLCRLIDGVIDFSRIQQGERMYVLTSGSIAPVVARTAERFRAYLALHDFTLQTSIDMTVRPVRFDEIAVEQAVLNLLDNAFNNSGDSRDLAVHVSENGDATIVQVQDRGVGIAPEEQGRIFERFQRGEHPDRGGYGLGLYLVRHVMAAHGGHVELESAPGRGSTFTLVFPIAAGPGTSPIFRTAAARGRLAAREIPEVSYAEDPARRG